MGNIHKLPDHIINQIKAGEVVERPLSVVKELVENSIDAGSTNIRVEVIDGGKQLIRITDNGCGMGKDDLSQALERHATSKIANISDLEKISTLGFRGEAIPSIASVSRFSLKSREKESGVGYEIETLDGVASEARETPMAVGTCITVKDLFANVPVRGKFLKATATEFAHIYDYLFATALAYPHVGFALNHNGREVFGLSPSSHSEERFKALLGADAKEFVPIEYQRGSFKVTGFAGLPDAARPTSKYFITFVNGRLVKDKVVRSGILQAYSGLIMKGLFPSAVLFLEVDPTWVDVNAHPAKTELRFRDSGALADLLSIGVQDGVKAFLRGQHTITQAAPAPSRPTPTVPAREVVSESRKASNPVVQTSKPAQAPAAASFTAPTKFASTPRISVSESPQISVPEPPRISVPESPRVSVSENTFKKSEDAGDSPTINIFQKRAEAEEVREEVQIFSRPQGPLQGAKILGQYHNCFILFEANSELWVVDQHAFHERILFEEFIKAYLQNKPIEKQEMLTPLLITAPQFQYHIFKDRLDDADKLGFKLEAMEPNTIAVHAFPTFLEPAKIKEVVELILEHFLQDNNASSENIFRHCFATFACHTAVRAGDPLSHEEMRRLLSRAGDVDFFSHCPHGRPVVRKFVENDVKAWFLRI